MKKHFIWIVTFTLIFMAGCVKDNMEPVVVKPITLPSNGEKVIAAQNRFAFNFFKSALRQDPTFSNKLISPMSIYLDLSMAYNGAAGATLDSMKKALQLDNVTHDQLNSTSKILMQGLPETDPKVTIRIANSIWYRDEGIPPLPDFLKITSHDYLARVTAADFNDPATKNEINGWVAGKTHDKIKKVIDHIDPTDVMYLINAVYFKGQWKFKFDSKETRNRTFNAPDEGPVQASFMTQTGAFLFYQNDSMACIELPYGSGAFNMYILLPDEHITARQLALSLNESAFKHVLSSMDSFRVQLWMPKWEYRYEIKNMKPELTDLGMAIAFGPHADFSNMYPRSHQVSISKALHKTYIAVDEKGTEAAAVTAIGIGTTSMPAGPPVMDINRPFLYVIAEKNTGAVLFTGEVNNPAEN